MTTPVWDRKSVPTIAPALIRRVEGTRLAAYKDSTGVPTIGDGSTFMLSGRRVQMGDRITSAQADELLAEQCDEWIVAVARSIAAPLTDAQAGALCSFVHNLGPNALDGSTLAKMANANRMDLAADQFSGWVVAGGVVSLGLMRRREYERQIFVGAMLESQAAYNAVWVMPEHTLLAYYQRAFTEARAWGWKGAAPAAASALHERPATLPHPTPPPTQTADDLNAAELAGLT